MWGSWDQTMAMRSRLRSDTDPDTGIIPLSRNVCGHFVIEMSDEMQQDKIRINMIIVFS